ncbi:MAG: cyclic nucleotide-binding domain-containing protein [Pseudomonadota bacterium]
METQDPKSQGKRTTAEDISAVNVKMYEPEQTIISEGEKKNCFYTILLGSVEVLQRGKNIRVLREGDVFGLESFFLHRPYTTTVRALTDVRIATYSTGVMKDIIYTRPNLTEKILNSLLNQLEQTTQIAEEHMTSEGFLYLNEKVYEDGETIIEEGTTGDEFFRLVETEGGLLVTKEGKQIGKIEKPGEFFGEMSGILNQPRSATVTSVGKSIVQVFSADSLDEIFESYPTAARNLLHGIAYRLSETDKRIVKVTEKKGEKKSPVEAHDYIPVI